MNNKKIMTLAKLTPLLAFVFFLLAVYYSTTTMLEKRYQQAIALIEQGKWYQAEQALKVVSNYQDVPVLQRYVQAMVKLDLAGEQINEQCYMEIIEILNQIPEEYQGDFKQEIAEFKQRLIQRSGIKDLSPLQQIGPYDGVKLVKAGDRYIYVELETLQPPFGDIPVSE